MLAVLAHLAAEATAELAARVKVAARVLWWGSALDRPTFRGPRPSAPVRFDDMGSYSAASCVVEPQDSRPAPAPSSPQERAPGREVAWIDDRWTAADKGVTRG